MSNNPYKSYTKNEDELRKLLLEEKIAAQKLGQYTDERMEEVTKDFCSWVESVGGDEQYNIEQKTVEEIFAIGKESEINPLLRMPLKVMEVLDVPSDLNHLPKLTHTKSVKRQNDKKGILRNSEGKNPEATKKKSKEANYSFTPKQKPNRVNFSDLTSTRSISNVIKSNGVLVAVPNYVTKDTKMPWVIPGINTSKTTREKFRYGAWYLNPKTWTKLQPGEKLESPKKIIKESKVKLKHHDFDEEVAKAHATKAFQDYVEINGKRRPEFFDYLETLQAKQRENELLQQQEENNEIQEPLKVNKLKKASASTSIN